AGGGSRGGGGLAVLAQRLPGSGRDDYFRRDRIVRRGAPGEPDGNPAEGGRQARLRRGDHAAPAPARPRRDRARPPRDRPARRIGGAVRRRPCRVRQRPRPVRAAAAPGAGKGCAMNWFDFAVLGVLALSGLLAMARGFVKELLSLAGWIIAAIVTF